MRSAKDIALAFSFKTICVEEVSAFIPIVGPVIAKSKSFAYALGYLTDSLNEIEEAALAVWDNAAKESVEENSSSTSTGK